MIASSAGRSETLNSTDKLTIAVVFDTAQAAHFVPPSGSGRTRLVAMGPSARLALKDRGFEALTTTELYSDDDHRAIAMEASRIREIVNHEAAAACGEYSSVTQRLIDITASLYLPAARLWKTIGDAGPWYCFDGARWRLFEHREEAFEALLRNIIPNGPVHVNVFGTYRGQWFVKFLQRILLWRAQRSPRWIAANRGRMQFGFQNTIRKPGERLVIPVSPRHFAADLRYVVRQLISLRIPDLLSIVAGWSNAAIDGRTNETIDRVFHHIDNPVLHRALAIFDGAIRNQVLGFARAERDIDHLLELLKPRLAASYQINNQLASALWAACERHAVQRVVFHHNSLCDASEAGPEANASMALTTERHYSRVPSDVYMAFSPVHQHCLERYLPEAQGRIVPFRMAPRPIGRQSNDDEFRVLFADNYMEWRDHLPVIMQTSDELFESIRDVCDVVDGIEGFNLAIRIKPKKELNPDVIARMISGYRRARVSAYSVPYRKELEAADVVIASMSTTIEEAFEYDTPVVLYGRQSRYSHLPNVVSHSERGLLYRAKSPKELGAVLKILHARRKEVRPVDRSSSLLWRVDIPTVEKLESTY